VAVLGGIWTMLHYPLAFLVFFIAFLLAAVWIVPKIWAGMKVVLQTVISFFSGRTPPAPPQEVNAAPKELPLA